jgi:hypothetical protein
LSWLPHKPHPERLKSYITWYLITAQIIQFGQEYFQPLIINRIKGLFKGGSGMDFEALNDPVVRQIKEEVDRPEWDTFGEYSEVGWCGAAWAVTLL